MKIDTLIIKGLFKTFNYEISLSANRSPLILTGLNGYGKTTILTIIKRLSEKDFFYFYRLPFDKISVLFDNDAKIDILSVEEKAQQQQGDEDYNLTIPREVKFIWTSSQEIVYTFNLGRTEIKEAVIYMHRRRFSAEYDVNSDDFYEQTLKNKAFYGYFRKDKDFNFISMMLDSLKVTFITAQRLDPIEEKVENDYPFESSIIRKPKISEVLQLIEKKLKSENIAFLSKSQYIDSKLIDCLLADVWSFDEHDYNKLKDEVSKKIADLKSFGLLGNITIQPYDNEHGHILSVYLKNMDEKLKTYDNILSKLKLFSNIVNSLDFVNKTISYSPEKGLIIKTKDGLFLDANKLSNGEQNEIVMLYEMIFDVADNTILLVDEPEISLHVAWQNKFLNMMSRIASNNKLQVVVATHSPQIIGDRWDECYDLCELCK